MKRFVDRAFNRVATTSSSSSSSIRESVNCVTPIAVVSPEEIQAVQGSGEEEQELGDIDEDPDYLLVERPGDLRPGEEGERESSEKVSIPTMTQSFRITLDEHQPVH